MAKTQPPPKKKVGKGAPPTDSYPNLKKEPAKTASEDYVGLNFRVPEDFAWEFKQAALSAKKKQNAFLYELLAAHKKIEEIEKSLTLIKDTVDREVREVMDRLLSLENRLQHVESLEPYINDIWRMIDTATAPAMANGKADSKEQVERM